MIYTDLFNTAFDDLCETLAEITGLTVVNDPRNMRPSCLLVNPPFFDAFNYNIAKLSFNCTMVAMGPGNLDAVRPLLAACASILNKNVALLSGRPTSVEIGGAVYPAYDLTIDLQAQTA